MHVRTEARISTNSIWKAGVPYISHEDSDYQIRVRKRHVHIYYSDDFIMLSAEHIPRASTFMSRQCLMSFSLGAFVSKSNNLILVVDCRKRIHYSGLSCEEL